MDNTTNFNLNNDRVHGHMNNSILKRVKRAYRLTKNVFSGEQKEYLWIYDNFYLIDRHYRAVLKSKRLITSVEKSGCFELIQDFCEEKNYRIERSGALRASRKAAEFTYIYLPGIVRHTHFACLRRLDENRQSLRARRGVVGASERGQPAALYRRTGC
jgi:hypothetical protein